MGKRICWGLCLVAQAIVCQASGLGPDALFQQKLDTDPIPAALQRQSVAVISPRGDFTGVNELGELRGKMYVCLATKSVPVIWNASKAALAVTAGGSVGGPPGAFAASAPYIFKTGLSVHKMIKCTTPYFTHKRQMSKGSSGRSGRSEVGERGPSFSPGSQPGGDGGDRKEPPTPKDPPTPEPAPEPGPGVDGNIS